MKEETLKAIDAVVSHQTRKITSLQSTVAGYAKERKVLLDVILHLSIDGAHKKCKVCDKARALLAERKEKEHAE